MGIGGVPRRIPQGFAATLQRFGPIFAFWHGQTSGRYFLTDSETTPCQLEWLVAGFWYREIERNLVGDADTVAFERDNFLRVIGHHSDILETQIDQDLRADPTFVLNHALARDFTIQLSALMEMDFRQRAGRLRVVDGEAATGMMQVQKYAAILLGNQFQGFFDQFRTIARSGSEDVSRQAVRVNTNERRRGPLESAANQGDMLVLVYIARVRNHVKVAEPRRQSGLRHTPNVALVLHAITDQVCNREHIQVVLTAKFNQLRHARHGAVFIHDFADHP